MDNPLGRLFQFISDTLNGAERSFLDLLSVLVPYATPAIPAYLTFWHVQTEMNFPVEIAWVTAFVVEVLGITSVSTAIRFYRNNQMYKSTKEQAPFWIAVGTYAFYLVIVLAVNVVLEMVSGERNGWVIFAIALFSLLSFPSGVLVSIRAQYSEVLEDRNERKMARRQRPTRTFAATSQSAPADPQPAVQNGKVAADWRTVEGKLQQDALKWIANSSASEIMQRYSLRNVRTAYDWKKRAKDKLH